MCHSKSAQKFIKTRDANENQRIKDIIENNLKHLPATGDIKPLEGFSDGRKRLCIGSIRIIFRYDEDNNLLILSFFDIGKKDLAMLKATTLQTAEFLDILPDEDVSIVNALIKKLVIAWDPDFTKVTARERELLEKSDLEMKSGDFVSEEDFWS